jgi:hypothetical protein
MEHFNFQGVPGLPFSSLELPANQQTQDSERAIESLELADLFKNRHVQQLFNNYQAAFNNYQAASKQAVEALRASNDSNSSRTLLAQENARLLQELEALKGENRHLQCVHVQYFIEVSLICSEANAVQNRNVFTIEFHITQRLSISACTRRARCHSA